MIRIGKESFVAKGFVSEAGQQARNKTAVVGTGRSDVAMSPNPIPCFATASKTCAIHDDAEAWNAPRASSLEVVVRRFFASTFIRA
jgi:hypothetical protein